MLTITKEQFTALSRVVYAQFQQDLLGHCRSFSPDLCRTITPEQLRAVVETATNNGRNYGFTKRGPLRLFVELTLLFGSFFDTDPQCPWVRDLLANAGGRDELALSWELYQATIHYLEAVHGNDDCNVFSALRRLRRMAADPSQWPASSSPVELSQQLGFIFPEKARFIGDGAVSALVSASLERCARRHALTSVNAQTLYCALTFAFGHGCDRDLLYPWIGRTLTDPLLATPEQRADRLFRKAVTWLDQVLLQE